VVRHLGPGVVLGEPLLADEHAQRLLMALVSRGGQDGLVPFCRSEISIDEGCMHCASFLARAGRFPIVLASGSYEARPSFKTIPPHTVRRDGPVESVEGRQPSACAASVMTLATARGWVIIER
jgi:hypothetical protein